MAEAGSSYYARRGARDPDWREQAIAAAGERNRRARKADPEHVRDVSRRYRARLREHALTITQLKQRVPVRRDCADLRAVLAQELERGTVELVQGGYYRLNGKLGNPETSSWPPPWLPRLVRSVTCRLAGKAPTRVALPASRSTR